VGALIGALVPDTCKKPKNPYNRRIKWQIDHEKEKARDRTNKWFILCDSWCPHLFNAFYR
jgi:hypothetical protein